MNVKFDTSRASRRLRSRDTLSELQARHAAAPVRTRTTCAVVGPECVELSYCTDEKIAWRIASLLAESAPPGTKYRVVPSSGPRTGPKPHKPVAARTVFLSVLLERLRTIEPTLPVEGTSDDATIDSFLDRPYEEILADVARLKRIREGS